MAQEWAKAFYKTRKWARCRASYIKERMLADGGICEECRDRPGYIVHHKIILTPENISSPETALNHEHLEYVCRDCHDLFEGHGLNKGGGLLCVFDADGQPVSVREIDRNKILQLPP